MGFLLHIGVRKKTGAFDQLTTKTLTPEDINSHQPTSFAKVNSSLRLHKLFTLITWIPDQETVYVNVKNKTSF